MVQKRAGSRMDVLLLGLIDYPRRVEAVSLYEHESRRRGVLDRKDYLFGTSRLRQGRHGRTGTQRD